MYRKYAVEVHFQIATEIEADGYIGQPGWPVGAEIRDWETNVEAPSETVRSHVGVEFTYETEAGKDEARNEVENFISGLTFSSNDDVHWEVTDAEIYSLEAETMSLEAAKAVLLAFCRDYTGDGANDELVAAITVVLDHIN